MNKTEIINNKLEVELDGNIEFLSFEILAVIKLISQKTNMDEIEFIEIIKDALIRDRNGEFKWIP
ncbi:MAG: hypothetical protein GX118_00525 [Arcobacter butzleri]|nr:hypothetical protein [Aliarcobacter butzleri]